MPAVNVMFGGGATAPHSNYAQTPSPVSSGDLGVGAEAGIIDGTPMRVATLVVLAIVGLAGLRWAGFKFNVTVG
jgi:uncharacterized membrane protein (Fun14 family)